MVVLVYFFFKDSGDRRYHNVLSPFSLHDALPISFRLPRFEAGYAYRLPLGPFDLALGGALAAYAKPAALDTAYGDAPISTTLFAKLSLGPSEAALVPCAPAKAGAQGYKRKIGRASCRERVGQ